MTFCPPQQGSNTWVIEPVNFNSGNFFKCSFTWLYKSKAPSQSWQGFVRIIVRRQSIFYWPDTGFETVADIVTSGWSASFCFTRATKAFAVASSGTIFMSVICNCIFYLVKFSWYKPANNTVAGDFSSRWSFGDQFLWLKLPHTTRCDYASSFHQFHRLHK